MRQNTFVKLSALAVGLVLLSFVVMGTTRLFLATDTARLLSAPTMLTGGALLVFLTLRSVLAVSGLRPLEE
ncbi:hypothetical protein HWV07_19270 [Natronomonas salina]|uniref:hypothetical protein n=1 Tax=Natronomonas salina TaxID=1710540 RepID=UPI0015B4B0D7|nr:hypothetical protein [Natronomonas salina]QLD91067.1 hypothetical protein HWV07_19270 [Natronomonas salina]